MDTLISLFAFPSSAVAAVVFLLTAIVVWRFSSHLPCVKWLGSVQAARILLGVGAVLLAVEGTWSIPLHRHVIFLLYALVLMFSLTLVVLNGLTRKAKWGFIFNHLGILLIFWASVFGAPDASRLKMIVGRGVTENMAFDDNYLTVNLPFHVKLQDFRIDYYPDSISPRQFTSHLLVEGEPMTTSVNHPCHYKGYTLYQDSYDHEAQSYTVLQVVRDPWLPLVYLGMLLLAIGSVMLLFGRWNVRLVLPISFLLSVVFTIFTVAKINFGTLMPALRSWWFVPHLFIYMVAYSLMALALLMWLLSTMRRRPQWLQTSDNLVRSSSALLIIGMLTGSVWANQAWGNYWAWDAKENWAAVTWFITLMHLHLSHHRGWRPIVYLVLAFLAIQITWYGVNYLPSAMHSLHTYNS